MSELERLKFWIHLLEMEVEALRSVLSEFDGDHMQFLQMQKANVISQLKDSLVKPSGGDGVGNGVKPRFWDMTPEEIENSEKKK